MIENPNIKIQKEEPDLYKRSIKGGFWVISSRFAVQLLGLFKSLFIVNFFLLNDLGIISAAVMMMEILNTFTQTGFESALIQKKGDIHDYLDTAWTAGILKGIVLFLILYFTAPLLASFRIPEEKVPLAIGVFRAMSVTFLITGFRNIGAIYFSKNLDFHKTFALSVTSTLADIVLSIGLVLIFRSIWGVIAARLVTACINCAGTYVLSSYRPKLHFEPKKAKDLWKFGRWIFGANILVFLINEGDDFFVWFYLGIQPLALYRYAYRFADMSATKISHVISQVAFPAYSKIQDDLPRLREAYLKVLKITALFSVPAAFLIFILGPDFVRLFLPERMYPMIFVLQLLAVKGLLKALGSPQGSLFTAIGKPEILMHFLWLRLTILTASIYPLTQKWGITGTAAATILINLLADPIAFWFTCRSLQCPILRMLRSINLPFAASGIMTFAVSMISHIILPHQSFAWFFVLIIIALTVYVCMLWLLDSLFKHGMREIVIEIFLLIQQSLKKNEANFKTAAQRR
jgi:O-antigen/teichoic acid export membrane protein